MLLLQRVINEQKGFTTPQVGTCQLGAATEGSAQGRVTLHVEVEVAGQAVCMGRIT